MTASPDETSALWGTLIVPKQVLSSQEGEDRTNERIPRRRGRTGR
jgi:hypothetical protein